jgi:TonB family protein
MRLIYIFLLLFTAAAFSQEGLVTNYYPNGKIESEINYVNKVRDGAAKFYWDNGNPKFEMNYNNGKVDGLVKEYYQNGNLHLTYTIQDGKREGPVSIYKEDGTYVTDIFYENGKRVVDEAENEEEVASANTDSLSGTSSGKSDSLQTTAVLKKVNETKVSTDTPPVKTTEEPDSLKGYLTSAERMPEPHGGWGWIYKRLSYPREAKEKNIQGTTEILAYIDENGNVKQALVSRGFNAQCDEAAKVAVMYTRFLPGLNQGNPVKVKMVIPVEFKLEGK